MSYDPSSGYPRVVPELRYRDPTAAVCWLCENFGFVETLRLSRPGGQVSHSELELEGGLVMIAPGPESLSPPATPDGYSVQIVFFVHDVEEHFRRTASRNINILAEPQDKPWGLRQYIALDLEGHGWQFTQHIKDVSPESWGAISLQ